MATTSGFLIGGIEFRKVTEQDRWGTQEHEFQLAGKDLSESDLIKITRQLLYEFPDAAKEPD